MSRRQIQYVVQHEGRDHSKLYVVTEMPASKAEWWAIRLLMAMARSGLEIPDNLLAAGMATVALLGIKALAQLQFNDAQALLSEMFECVEIMPDRNNPMVVRKLVENDIEEVETRLLLRKAIFELHTGFSSPAAPQK